MSKAIVIKSVAWLLIVAISVSIVSAVIFVCGFFSVAIFGYGPHGGLFSAGIHAAGVIWLAETSFELSKHVALSLSARAREYVKEATK